MKDVLVFNDNNIKIDVKLEDDTVWLNQAQMCTL